MKTGTITVTVHKHNITGMEITFHQPYGEQITFFLNEEDKNTLLMNIDRFIHDKKDVTREMYNLKKL